MEYLYHIAKAEDWNQAIADGEYKTGSLHRSFEHDGFIHLCYIQQINVIADQIYSEAKDLLLLTIDPTKLEAELKVELAVNPPERFPHLYGPLNTSAVILVESYNILPNGKFPTVKNPLAS